MIAAATAATAKQDRKAQRAVSAAPTRAQSQLTAHMVRAARPAAEPATALASRMAAKRCFNVSGGKERLTPLVGLKGLDLTTAASKLITETLGLSAEEQVHVVDVTPIGRPLKPSDTSARHGRLFIRVDCLVADSIVRNRCKMQSQGPSAGHLRPSEPRRGGCSQAALVHLHRSPQEGQLSGQATQWSRCARTVS